MPELPEITCRAQEMTKWLANRPIQDIEVKQPKCLNVSARAFRDGLLGAKLGPTSARGKWLVTETSKGHLLINLGMGGELLLIDSRELPDKWRIRFELDHGKTLAVNFWWFGNVHFAAPGQLASHAPTAKLGPNALDVTQEAFRALMQGRRGGVKAFLLDQSKIAGIGNAYVHDILFRAGLHPMRPISELTRDEIDRLHQAIRDEFLRSIAVGGAHYELNLLGTRGGFGAADLLVGYREGKPCPECGTTIEKLKTGSTTGYLCPKCQRKPGLE